MSTKVTVINQERANPTKEDMQKIIDQWKKEAVIHQIVLPKKTEEFCNYFLQEMNQQGVLFQSIRTISQRSGINVDGTTTIIDKLVKLNIIYKNYGIVGIQDFKPSVV